MAETVFIAFGSNVGDRLHYCDRALTLLSLLPGIRAVAVSSLYETEPVRDTTDPGPAWFLNGVVQLETDLPSRRLLEACREAERALGRDLARRGGPRTLDLDILFYGDRIIRDGDLQIPHPRLHQRRFVLEPLAELAPDWRHPVLYRSVRELLAQLPHSARVLRRDPPSSRYGARSACAAQPTRKS
jgi:2-amino-4-hydroxy-6-hydroxymethyldihydropteridine diphosphokinase